MLFNPQDFSFLKIFKDFQLKKTQELFDKILIKSDGKSVDFVLHNQSCILIKTFSEVEKAIECSFIVELDSFDKIMSQKTSDRGGAVQMVDLTPGLLTQGSRSQNVLQTYPIPFTDYKKEVDRLNSSDYKETVHISDLEKFILASKYTNKDDKLGLIHMYEDFLISTDRNSTVLFKNEPFIKEPGYEVDIQIIKTIYNHLSKNKPKVKKGEKPEPLSFDLTFINDRHIHFNLDDVQIYFRIPAYKTVTNLLESRYFIPSYKEEKYILLDSYDLEDALKKIQSATKGEDAVVITFSEKILKLETDDRGSYEEIDILENNHYLSNFSVTVNITGLLKILGDIQNLELSDRVKFYHSGDTSLTVAFKIEDSTSSDFQFYRTRIRD